jgi:hypothetical protein
MADNVTTQTTTLATIPGSTKISTDEDLTNGHVQRMKLAVSADGSSTHIGGDADGLQVQGAAADGAALAGNPVLVAGSDGTNAQNISVDASGNVQVDIVADAAGLATAANQLADGHNVTVDNAAGASAVNIQDGGNSITVDGTVTANLSATDNAVLDTIEVNTSYGDNTGGGVELGSLRVTLANDSTGLLSVDDNGGSLTVDNADITTIAGAVAAGQMQVDIVADGAGLATSANQTTMITALELIDDIVYTDDTSTHATGTSKGAGIMAAATPTDGSVIANDIGMLAMSLDRRLHTDTQIVGTDAALDVSAATVTVDLSTNNDVTIDGSSVIRAEDDAHSTGHTGIMGLAVQQTADAALAGTTGDYAPLQVDETGYLKVNIKAGSASGTEYTEDAAAPGNPAGGAVSLVRQDTPATLVSADGDIVAQRATNYGAAFVQVLDSSGNFINAFGGSGGTSHADDAAFTIGGASSITPTGYLVIRLMKGMSGFPG